MSVFGLRDREGNEIADWRSWTRPKQKRQWRAGRSAMELARAWFTSPVPICPLEIETLLASHPRTAGVRLVEGMPEHVTALTERGEGRNHDLLLVGQREGRKVVISVEAKVDEPFGEPIGDYWRRARASEKPTRAPKRIQSLLSMVFGPESHPDAEPWCRLRYQLLTAVAGTALEAAQRDADTALFLVHQFRTDSADDQKIAANDSDLGVFMRVMCPGAAIELRPDFVCGPAALPAGKHLGRTVDMFIGKAVYDWKLNLG